jgi:hypothetical protein
MMKKYTLFTLLLIASFNLFAYDWPQENVEQTSIKSYFGQKRGEAISTSLVFSDPEPIKCIEDGKILIIMSDESDDSVFFPSTYGTSVILSHDDSLLSVYGNLDKEEVAKSIGEKSELSTGDIIGQPGNSGWQNGTSSLELQIIDTKKATAINPKILITRTNTELPLKLEGIVLESKSGTKVNLAYQRTIKSGLYKIYQKRNPVACPYKSTVAINGVVVDQISYDTINHENNRLYVSGKKKYTSIDIYPDGELQLLGETMFTAGKSTLGLTLNDFLGKGVQQNFIITVY